MTDNNPYNLKVGQVWEADRGRERGRRVLITAVTENYAHIKVLQQTPSTRNPERRPRPMRLDRFYPNGNGYALVKDVGD